VIGLPHVAAFVFAGEFFDVHVDLRAILSTELCCEAAAASRPRGRVAK
jgi:hypothetical protein